MKKSTPACVGITLAFALTPLASWNQYHHQQDETTIGLSVEPIFSGFNYNGLTPSITIGCSTYQLQFGPRFNFNKMIGADPNIEQDMVWDFGFRYSFVQQSGFSLFAGMRGEYGRLKYLNDWYYDYGSGTFPENVMMGDSSFNARTSKRHYNLNLYLGLGAEYILVDKLYVSVFGGAGIKTLTGYTQHIHRGSAAVLVEEIWLLDRMGGSWMVTAGIGYRL
jgi:hypothetical protein